MLDGSPRPIIDSRSAELIAWKRSIGPAQCRPNKVGRGTTGWPRLLKRVFDIDMQHCPNCGAGELKIIAAILERPVIEEILTHLGLDAQPPLKGRAGEPWPHFAA